MPHVKLTAKQEKFAQCIADGMSQADAYRECYSTENKTKKSVNECACVLANNIKVVSRVNELKQKLEKKYLWTREQAIKTLLEEAKSKAKSTSDYVAIVKELNNMHGYNEKNLNLGGQKDNPIALIPATADPDTWEIDENENQ